MNTNIKLNVSKNIRIHRKKCGYTQEKLAELASIDYKYLQRLEGKNPPNIKLETIAKLAKVLKIDSSELLQP